MKRTLIAVALSVACASAFATGLKPTNECGNRGNNCNPVQTAPSNANASSNANGIGVGIGVGVGHASNRTDVQSSAAAVGIGGAGGNARAAGGAASAMGGSALGIGGSANGGNNSQTLTVNNVNPADVKIRNVPSVNAWAAAPSATCVVTTGGSVNVPGFGGGLSTGTIDKGCEARENARFLASLGATMEAVRVLCRAQPDVAAEMEDCKDIHDEHVKRANEKARGVNPANQFNVTN